MRGFGGFGWGGGKWGLFLDYAPGWAFQLLAGGQVGLVLAEGFRHLGRELALFGGFS